MNNNELQAIWQTRENQPSGAFIDEQKNKFLKRLRNRHRGFLLITGWAAFWMVFTLIRLVYFVSKGGPFTLKNEWGAVIMMILPCAALIFFFIQHRNHRRSHARPDLSIHASIQALLDENRLAILRGKIIAALHISLLVMMPLIVFQLRAAGKAGDEILVPAFVLFPLLMFLVLTALAILHWRRLLPKRRELEALLASYT